MGQEEQVDEHEVGVRQRLHTQVALALRQAHLQVHEQAVRCLGSNFLLSLFTALFLTIFF